MAARKYVYKPGEKKSDVSRDSTTTSTAASIVVEVASGITTPELVKALEVMRLRAIEIDAIP